MARASTTHGNQTLWTELSALQSQHKTLQNKTMETRGIVDVLCIMLIQGGMVSEQRLSAEMHRLSFAAVRRTHPCDWTASLRCVLRSSDVAFNLASFFVNKKDCAGLCMASESFATCMAEASSAMVRPKVLIWRGAFFDVFDPVSRAWDAIPSALEWRLGAASAVIGGRLYVCGGNSGMPSTSLDCFDPWVRFWQALPPMSLARFEHTAAVLGSRLFVCCGAPVRDDSSAECFDTLTDVWQALPPLVHSRRHARAEVIRNQIYVVGGETSERLPPTGTWQELPRMHHSRVDFATAVVADRLYVCGGQCTSVERFDPNAGVWELLQPMLEDHDLGAFAVLHGQLYVCGGGDTSSAERFDPTRNTWERLAPMTRERGICDALVTDGGLFVCGDETWDEDVDEWSLPQSAEWFDPATGSWQFLRDLGEEEIRRRVFVIPC